MLVETQRRKPNNGVVQRRQTGILSTASQAQTSSEALSNDVQSSSSLSDVEEGGA